MYNDNCCVGAPVNGFGMSSPMANVEPAILKTEPPPTGTAFVDILNDQEKVIHECLFTASGIIGILANEDLQPKCPDSTCAMHQLINNTDNSRELLKMLTRIRQIIGGNR